MFGAVEFAQVVVACGHDDGVCRADFGAEVAEDAPLEVDVVGVDDFLLWVVFCFFAG